MAARTELTKTRAPIRRTLAARRATPSTCSPLTGSTLARVTMLSPSTSEDQEWRKVASSTTKRSPDSSYFGYSDSYSDSGSRPDTRAATSTQLAAETDGLPTDTSRPRETPPPTTTSTRISIQLPLPLPPLPLTYPCSSGWRLHPTPTLPRSRPWEAEFNA